MNTSLEEAIKEAYAIAPTNVVIYHTLEIRQPSVQSSVFLVQARRGITATDEDGNERNWQPVGFQFSLPPSNEDGFQSLNIAIDNINQRVTDFVNIAKSPAAIVAGVPVPVEILYRPFVSTDLSRPQMSQPITLFLKEVSLTNNQVTGRATFMDIVNKKFPSELYTRARFPTLG